MALATGTRLGPFEILASLGAGGMGEVYRARDTQLGRDVAIKVLPPAFVADRERLARFEREARVLATLNHPHIGAIYGVERVDDIPALVLELVEGQTLAERIRGTGLGAYGRPRPVALVDALAIARQIAEALEAAHEKSIVHRDLKPANIKITPAGAVKVLDFGLAKDLGTGGDLHAPTPVPSQLPTVTIAGTREGVLLGTAAYMSPEQARGQAVDKRTDIWAFGCVLYEMLTGRVAFPGATVSDHIAAILKREPDWAAVPEAVPPAMRRLLRRCLEKDPTRRLHDIADARIELDDARDSSTAATQPGDARNASGTRRRAVGLREAIALALFGSAIGALGVWSVSTRVVPTPRLVTRFAVQPSAAAPFAGSFKISPDGTRLVYVAMQGSVQRLFVRRLDEFDAAPLAGTEGAYGPFFSPDSQWVGFVAGGKLKKIRVSGSASPVVVCDTPSVLGTTWAPDGTIMFGRVEHGLQRVSAEGGVPQQMTTLDANRHEIDHHNPELLPGGKTLIFTIHEGVDLFRVGAQTLVSGQRQVLIADGFDAQFVPGHLVYASGHSLYAVRFDPDRVAVTGAPVKLLDDVATVPGSGVGHFSLSNTGSLVVLPEIPRSGRRLVWVDRSGAATPLPIDARKFAQPRLSPDGRRLAFAAADETRNDVWIYDLAKETLVRATSEGTNSAPVWTHDSLRLTYSSVRAGVQDLLWQPADGSASPESLVSSRNELWPGAWTADGRALVYVDSPPTDWSHLALLRRDGERRSQPLTTTTGFADDWPALSPDGHWLALVSFATGRHEVFVQPFPGPGPRRQVTVDGGRQPVWSRDGRELFYVNGNGMYAIPVNVAGGFVAGKPALLFLSRYACCSRGVADYDVAPDGRRFVMVKPSEEELVPRHLDVVLNWSDELERRVPTK